MTNFFLVDGDEQRARGAEYLDDVDLIYSKEACGPWGPSLVVVAQREGMHVCWRCGEHFDPSSRKQKPVETVTGHSRVLLHAACVAPAKSMRSFHDITRGLQARRFFARAVKTVEGAIESVKERLSE